MRFLVILLSLVSFNAYAVSDRFAVANQGSVTATVTSTKIINENKYRQYLLIQNVGTDTVIIKLASAQSGTEGIQIPAGGNYEPSKAPTDSVWIETASGSQSVSYIEGQ